MQQTDRFRFQSLDLRRKLNSVTFLYKLLLNKIYCSDSQSQINFHVPRLNSRNTDAFYCSQAKTNLILFKSPLYNMCNLFNAVSHLCDINHDHLKTLCHVL